MDTSEKVRENRLRREVSRRGYRLIKSRRRDPFALDYGRYLVKNADGTESAAYASPEGLGLTLDEVEERLAREAEELRNAAARQG